MKTLQFLILVTFVTLFAGCATVPPNELVNARSAYQHASEGPAEQLAPAELHTAHEALILAEQSFLKEPDSHKTKDLAYVAQRKSEQAGALGAMAADKASKDKANADFQKRQTEIVKQGKQDLSDSEKRIADARAELDKNAAVKAGKDKSDAELAALQASKDKSDAELQAQQAETVRQGRQDLSDSEKRIADARAELDKNAAVKASKDKSDAELAALQASKDKADAELQAQQAETARQRRQDLIDSEKRTADARAELDKNAAVKAGKDKSDAELAALQASKDKSDAELQAQQAETVRQGRQDLIDSEKRTADARAELAKLAAVKEEERGLVVTLSGGVLFQSAQSTLLSSAQVKLGQVADALLSIRARNLIVEGHTDSQGSESYNQGLSQRRADAVRDYLVQRGYPADRIQSRGMGEGSPIADNASPEGRANNRRVEIVIERPQKSDR